MSSKGRITFSLKTDLMRVQLERLVKLLLAEIDKIGVRTWGPDYLTLKDNPTFTRSGVTFNRTPTGMRAALAGLFEEAWRDRYAEIASSYEQSKTWEEWKRYHRGFKPYTDGRFRVAHTREAKMTGHLEESVAKEMLRMRNGKYLEFTNLSVQGGFRFMGDLLQNPSGANNVYPIRKYDKGNLSYVIRFLEFLRTSGVIGRNEPLVDFSPQYWNKISIVMADYARREYIRGIEQFIKGWKVKL